MNQAAKWDAFNHRLNVIWADSLQGLSVAVDEDGGLPVLRSNGVRLPLAPSQWGLGDPEHDGERIEKALETLVQGHAPDYWRESTDPLVQALGWLDKRIGKRSWRQHDETHGLLGRSPLEQQVRALRDHADAKFHAPAVQHKQNVRP